MIELAFVSDTSDICSLFHVCQELYGVKWRCFTTTSNESRAKAKMGIEIEVPSNSDGMVIAFATKRLPGASPDYFGKPGDHQVESPLAKGKYPVSY